MKLQRRVVAFAATLSLMIAMTGHVAQAASKKISSVSIKITSNIVVGSQIDPDAVEVTSKSSRYSVDTVEFTNSGFSWDQNAVPELEIELVADEDYIFSLKVGDVKITGGQYVSAKTRDSAKTLVVKATLPSLSEQTGEVTNSRWVSSNIAGWDAAIGAGSYEIKLYRDGKAVGGTRQTDSTTFNFGTDMVTAGAYHFQVRPVNKTKQENKGSWVEGPRSYIDSLLAEQLKSGGASWQQDENGWWYRNIDGTHPSNSWQQIGEQWYYFDGNGYMQTGWIESNGARYYCDPTNGDMWVNRAVGDGTYVGTNGMQTDQATWDSQQAAAEPEQEVSWDEWSAQWKDEDE